DAVKSISDFCIALGINIPTGKDSLSMKQKYQNDEVIAPGTVIISSIGNCTDINNIIEPVLKKDGGPIYYLNLSQDRFKLGGSAFAQTLNKIGQESPDIISSEFLRKSFDGIQHLIKHKKIVAGHDISSGGLITTLLEMCFADHKLGAKIDLSDVGEHDTIKLLFSENAGVVFQMVDESAAVYLREQGISFYKIGSVINAPRLEINNGDYHHDFDIHHLRDVWYETSYLLDQKQSGEKLALERYQNYKEQPLNFNFPADFGGKRPKRNPENKIKAAIIRDQGSNSERELANALYLAGFEVKDVHMTDLISGRETLEDIHFLGAVGGFSNSDVLGSAKGWAGSFLYNDKAKKTLDNFFKRSDTLSIGICNGCQLFVELDLINPELEKKGKMLYNDSHKHESAFTSVQIQKNNSVMMSSLQGANLGVWISHGEGKFHLPLSKDHYDIVAQYAYNAYPSNPNGSDYNTAMMCSPDGRHLVTMPHIERSIFPWHWAYYPDNRQDEVSPWIEAFNNAYSWLEKKLSDK
ncbi:MAG: phosphoribosylformylglycinamidine synthase subunit PurQ, partial [Saprospiraceae bacterium]|nr:phosphoribosylformylglycinamidine synthase subunit PurQ [Saprospiraceae bacterium]